MRIYDSNNKEIKEEQINLNDYTFIKKNNGVKDQQKVAKVTLKPNDAKDKKKVAIVTLKTNDAKKNITVYLYNIEDAIKMFDINIDKNRGFWITMDGVKYGVNCTVNIRIYYETVENETVKKKTVEYTPLGPIGTDYVDKIPKEGEESVTLEYDKSNVTISVNKDKYTEIFVIPKEVYYKNEVKNIINQSNEANDALQGNLVNQQNNAADRLKGRLKERAAAAAKRAANNGGNKNNGNNNGGNSKLYEGVCIKF